MSHLKCLEEQDLSRKINRKTKEPFILPLKLVQRKRGTSLILQVSLKYDTKPYSNTSSAAGGDYDQFNNFIIAFLLQLMLKNDLSGCFGRGHFSEVRRLSG